MAKEPSLQDSFLLRAKTERTSVTLFLVNGYQLRGRVTGFDPFTVVLMSDGRQQLIYKHAISTMIPERPLTLGNGQTT